MSAPADATSTILRQFLPKRVQGRRKAWARHPFHDETYQCMEMRKMVGS